MNKILENPDVVTVNSEKDLEYVESFLDLILKDLKKILVLQRGLF